MVFHYSNILSAVYISELSFPIFPHDISTDLFSCTPFKKYNSRYIIIMCIKEGCNQVEVESNEVGNQVEEKSNQVEHYNTELRYSDTDSDTRLRHSDTNLDTRLRHSNTNLDTQLRHYDTKKVSLSYKQRDIRNTKK